MHYLRIGALPSRNYYSEDAAVSWNIHHHHHHLTEWPADRAILRAEAAAAEEAGANPGVLAAAEVDPVPEPEVPTVGVVVFRVYFSQLRRQRDGSFVREALGEARAVSDDIFSKCLRVVRS